MPGSTFTGTAVGIAPFTVPCTSWSVASTVRVTSLTVPFTVVSVVDAMPSTVPVASGSRPGAGVAALCWMAPGLPVGADSSALREALSSEDSELGEGRIGSPRGDAIAAAARAVVATSVTAQIFAFTPARATNLVMPADAVPAAALEAPMDSKMRSPSIAGTG